MHNYYTIPGPPVPIFLSATAMSWGMTTRAAWVPRVAGCSAAQHGPIDLALCVLASAVPGSPITTSAARATSLPLSLPNIPLFPVSSTTTGVRLTTTPSQGTSRTSTVPLGTKLTVDGKQTKLPHKVANSIVPVPGKLVSRIQALEYVDMRELLPALAECLVALPQGLALPKPPGEREITGDKALMTWVSSFATYVAIIAEAHPARVGDMLAYMRLIVREASKFGGNGWLTYDAVFRRNQEGLSTPWNYIDASLHQVFITNQQGKVVVPCKHCYEVDHL